MSEGYPKFGSLSLFIIIFPTQTENLLMRRLAGPASADMPGGEAPPTWANSLQTRTPLEVEV